MTTSNQGGMVMILRTRIFDLYHEKYTGLSELAQAMGISVAQIYRVRQGMRPINEKFILGAMKAFTGYKLDDLFYIAYIAQASQGSRLSGRMSQVVPTPQKPALDSRVMLTTGDVARLLNVHMNTVRRWSNEGILKSCRISCRGDRRFRREDVDGLLKEEEIE